MLDLPITQLLLVIYLSLVLAKSFLCYASLDIALGTAARYIGKRRCLFWAVLMLILIPLVSLVTVPALLFRERLAFFGVYSKFHVMREVISNIV